MQLLQDINLVCFSQVMVKRQGQRMIRGIVGTIHVALDPDDITVVKGRLPVQGN